MRTDAKEVVMNPYIVRGILIGGSLGVFAALFGVAAVFLIQRIPSFPPWLDGLKKQEYTSILSFRLP